MTAITPSADEEDFKEGTAAPLSDEVLWYLESRGYEVPDKTPLWRTPEPVNVEGAVFDPERVDKVIRAVEALRHTKGRWAGKPLKLEPIQIAYFVAPIFGWIHQDSQGDWVRIIREVWIEMPRKGAKTTLSGAFCMYLAFADGEGGAEVILGAASKDQARIAYQPLKALVDASPAMKRAGIKATKTQIEKAVTSSTLKPVSSRGDLAHGANVHGGLIDELHVHKSPDLLEAIETGVGSRSQPLTIIITTADDGSTTSVYAQRRERIEKICRGSLEGSSTYGVIFAMPRKGDPFDEKNWYNANPLYPVTPTPEYMRAQAEKAKSSPAELASFLRLGLGVRSDKAQKFFDMERWDMNAGEPVPFKSFRQREAYGGLDLGSVSDLTALVWMMPRADGGFDVVPRFWLPEDALKDLDGRTHRTATSWVKRGLITLTPGDTTDYNYIKDQILDDMDVLDVVQIGYDRWNASQLVNDLIEADVPMVRVPQNLAAMSPAMKELDRLIRIGSRGTPMIRHQGNQVLKWNADNLRARSDANGNIAPDKKNSLDKIDGISATLNALSTFLALNDGGPSEYETRGLEVV